MKVVDTFLFSEPYESDLLYLKFKLESERVHAWILQESKFTLKGEEKGLHAETVLAEPRFAEFIDRILIIQNNDQWFGNDTSEGTNFRREGLQRTLCSQLLPRLGLTSEDLIIVSDTDEAIDFSSSERTQRFDSYVNGEPFWVGRMRYWYDYDNRCFLPNIYIPVLPYKYFLYQPDLLQQVRHFRQTSHPAHEKPVAFEYSYVFKSLEELWRKKQTYSHTGFTVECLQQALKANHWPRPQERGEKLGDNPYDFFETVELNEDNSPQYVRDNLSNLKTNIVNPNYHAERKL